jgi:hypothetical protein
VTAAAPVVPRGALLVAAGPLLATGAFVALASALAPHVSVPDPIVDPIAVLVVVTPALLALARSSGIGLSGKASMALFGFGGLILATLYFAGFSRAVVGLQVFGLLAVGRGLGGAIGERVTHPGHVLAASIVAATADLASVLSPEGVSNAIVANDRALSIAALAAPVMGSTAMTFVLGAGDLVMMSLVFAVARRFEVSRTRVAFAFAIGLFAAFALSALLARPIPALCTIALAGTLSSPRFFRVAPRDRTATIIGACLCAGVIASIIVRR